MGEVVAAITGGVVALLAVPWGAILARQHVRAEQELALYLDLIAYCCTRSQRVQQHAERFCVVHAEWQLLEARVLAFGSKHVLNAWTELSRALGVAVDVQMGEIPDERTTSTDEDPFGSGSLDRLMLAEHRLRVVARGELSASTWARLGVRRASRRERARWLRSVRVAADEDGAQAPLAP